MNYAQLPGTLTEYVFALRERYRRRKRSGIRKEREDCAGWLSSHPKPVRTGAMSDKGEATGAALDAPTDGLTNLIAETIDKVITLDVSGYGVIGELSLAARTLYGRPPSMLAAERLLAACEGGGTVFITTGWTLPGMFPYGETDGPVGAALLARALGIATAARTVLLTEPWLVAMVTAACRAAGLNAMSEQDIDAAHQEVHPRNPHCLVIPLPVDSAQGLLETERLFAKYAPRAVVAIEKSGPNSKGRYAMVDGFDNSDSVAKVEHLFARARSSGVLTIGIGDRGNEVGFAKIAAVPRRVLPFGEEATNETDVDVLVVASVSNWGASGIAAAMAARLDRPEILHTSDLEGRVIEKCVDAGAFDGFSCRPELAVDGMGLPIHTAVTTLLNEIVRAPAARGLSIFSTPVFKRSAK